MQDRNRGRDVRDKGKENEGKGDGGVIGTDRWRGGRWRELETEGKKGKRKREEGREKKKGRV